MHLRRYYTLLTMAADADGQAAAASAVLGLRAAVEGTPLPSTFPHRAAVIAAGYPCVEDLPPAVEAPAELALHGLSPTDAADVAAAL